MAADYSPAATAALPLGSLGGVPPSAVDVPLQTVLQDSAPLLARQSVEPSLLLLPASRRPGAVRRPAKLLAKTYPALVRRNIKVGLQRLAPRRKVWRHNGRLLEGGAFAVYTSSSEHRVISDLPVNDLIDPDRLLKPIFAYPPRLRVVRLQPGGLGRWLRAVSVG